MAMLQSVSVPAAFLAPDEGGGQGSGFTVVKDGRRREIKVARRVLDVNEQVAAENRRRFAEHGVFVLNLMSSPGAGKTATLVETLKRLPAEIKCAVIVGDVATTRDADRLAVTGAPIVQVETARFGGDCHLAAHVIQKASEGIDLAAVDLLVIENIGNLVCPAEFDIGEDKRAVVLSVTEGEDKPIKYPQMFRLCDVALLNKIDLLPYLDFDLAQAVAYIRQVHPQMPIFQVSALTGDGLADWIGWLAAQVAAKRSAAGV